MWWSSRAVLTLAAAALLLAGCGFRPLYGKKEQIDTVAYMAQIRFSPPEDRLAQVVRSHLIDLATPMGQAAAPIYYAEIKVTEGRGAMLLTRQEDVARFNLTQSGTLTLRRSDSGQVVFSTSRSVTAAFNTVRADFADLSAEREASQRASRELAEHLRLALAVYFQRRATEPERQARPLPQIE